MNMPQYRTVEEQLPEEWRQANAAYFERMDAMRMRLQESEESDAIQSARDS